MLVPRHHQSLAADERVVFALENTDANSTLAAGASGMDPEWPVKTVVGFLTFSGGTRGTRAPDRQRTGGQKRTGAHPSWLSMFDNLDRLLTTP
jgi:hypothetical protein